MKKLLFCFFIAIGSLANAQEDTARKQIAILFGGNAGAGFSLTKPTHSGNYGEMMHEGKAYFHYSLYASVLWKEKMGFRFTFGKVGRQLNTKTFDEFAVVEFPAYHYLPDYSSLKAGYTYTYFSPQISYRIGSEPFNFTGSFGPGYGKLTTPNGEAVLQENGSNDFFVLNYQSGDMWCLSEQLNIEAAYMRQLSQHLFLNTGIYVNALVINSSYEYHVTRFDYTSSTLTQNVYAAHGDPFLLHINTGIFLNFQWNKRESERAYYE